MHYKFRYCASGSIHVHSLWEVEWLLCCTYAELGAPQIHAPVFSICNIIRKQLCYYHTSSFYPAALLFLFTFGWAIFECSGFYLCILNNSWRIKAPGCLYAGIAVYVFALSSKGFGLVLAIFLSLLSFSLLLLILFKVHSAATSLAADLLKYHTDHMILKALKITGVEGNLEAVAEYTCKLSEQKEQLVEVSSQLFWF